MRKEKIADQIRDVVSEQFVAGRIEDPALQTIGITAAKITPDLQLASIYFRHYSEDFTLEQIQAGLERAKNFLRNKVAKKMALRRVPELRFFYDQSVENGSKIEGLIAKLNQQRD